MIKWQTGETLLAAAAQRGDEPMVRLWVEFGALLDEPDQGPNRAMQVAVKAGHDRAIKTLIELGAKRIVLDC